MIMHTFADWGNTGQNMAESIEITTVSTTKADGEIVIKAKVLGGFPSSKGLLAGNVVDFLLMEMRKKYKNYCNFSEF